MRLKQGEAFIYMLVNSKTAEIGYVGRCNCSLKDRLSGHISEAKARRVYPGSRHTWIQAILAAGHKPAIVLLEVTADPHAELQWCCFLIGRGHKLRNAVLPCGPKVPEGEEYQT
jgi:hypothetical protein